MSLLRALRRRCPLCGTRDVWVRWGQMREHCPGCGYRFEREEGYWVGAMIVNQAVLLLAVFGFLVGGFVAFSGDVPWWFVLLAVVVIALLGVSFYPRSKTVWVWLDLTVHPYEGDERPTRH